MCSGTWLDSNTVPIFTVKGLLQLRQFHKPRRVVFPLERDAFPIVPQCGQIGPFGQSRVSTYSMAAASFAKWATLKADFMGKSRRRPKPLSEAEKEVGCALARELFETLDAEGDFYDEYELRQRRRRVRSKSSEPRSLPAQS